MWDNLLGESHSFSSVSKTAIEIQALAAENRASIEQDLAPHQTPESWAQEGFGKRRKIWLFGWQAPCG